MTNEPRDPGVRRIVFELLEAAPAPPPFPERIAAMSEERVLDRGRTRRLRAVGVLLVVVLVAGTVAVALFAGRDTSRPRRPTVAHVPNVAPDVAFVDKRGLVVRAGGSPRDVVVATGSVSTPRWSPSGKWLAYAQSNRVWVVRADGSHRERLTGDAGPNYLSDTYVWSDTVDALAVPFGSVVLVTWFTNDAAGAIHFAPPVGGVEPTAQSLAWSHDGRSLAISMTRRTSAAPGAPQSSLWLATDLCTPSTASCSQPRGLRRLPYTPGADEYPIYLAGFGFDDHFVLAWPDDIGSTSIALDGLRLKAIPIGGGAAPTIAGTLVRDGWVQPSPDGSRLLVVRSNGRMVTDPRAVDVCDAPTRCRPVAPGKGPQQLDPAWAPAGNRIAFVRKEHGTTYPPVVNNGIDWTIPYRNRTLWIANADGTHAHEITAAGGGVADPQFSPDGSSIVFVRDARLWEINLTTDRVTALSGSMRVTTSCTVGDCLPDAAVYETEAQWSDHEAVNFALAKP